MRLIVRILVLLLGVGFLFGLYLFIERIPAYQKVRQIKVGMTRADLGKLFEHDGGTYYTYNNESYILKNYRCHDFQTSLYSIVTLSRGRAYWVGKAIKVKVSFDPSDLPNEAAGSYWNPQDKITKISGPFCEFPVRD